MKLGIGTEEICKFLQVSIIIYPLLSYLTGVGIIAYGPLILSLCLIVLFMLINEEPIEIKHWLLIFVFIPYVFVAGYAYIRTPYQGVFLSPHFLTLLVLPFLVLSNVRLTYYSKNTQYSTFIFRMILFFILYQLVICIGQYSTYILGVGLPINELYRERGFVSGTFFNPNDLGAIILLISFIFKRIENEVRVIVRFSTWVLISSLLLISGSRTAIMVFILLFIGTRGFNRQTLLLTCFLVLFSYISLTVLSNYTDNVLVRILNRIYSIQLVFEHGINADSSMMLRLKSYMHFVSNLGNLGLGTGELLNYTYYAKDSGIDRELMFLNPHSLVVELGYWLGWPGLLCFMGAIIYLLGYAQRPFLLAFVLFSSSLIPSSVLSNIIYFYFFICAFFVQQETKVESFR